MKIADTNILPGKEYYINLPVAKLPTRTPIDIPVVVARAKEDGPTLLLEGGLHGDEINGTEIMRRLIDNDLHIPIKGITISIPVLNVFGFIHYSREVPDGKDVNRSFPGSANGSLASKVAHTLMKEIIPLIDYGIDFHTGGDMRANFPQIRCNVPNKDNEMLANAFHAPFTIDAALIPKSLRCEANKKGKNIIVYEAGESQRFDEFAIQEGINGTLRLMKALGMRRDAPSPLSNTISIKKMIWLRATAAGLWLPKVDNGEKVEKKQRMGYITSPFGDFREDIIASKAGYVVGLNYSPVVNRGDALVHIGLT